MSVPILLSSIDDEDKEDLANELTIKEQPPKKFGKQKKIYNPNPIIVETFDVRKYKGEYNVFIPLNYSSEMYGNGVFLNHSQNFSNVNFTGKLTDLQVEVAAEAKQRLKKYRTCFISMQCGLGKTITALFLLSKLKKKAIVLVHRIVLINQWIESINKFLPGTRIEICGANCSPSEDVDIYIMNMMNVEKIYPEQFEKVGVHVIIVDEAHVACTKSLSKSLLYLCPDYIIGLSATPYRADGLDKVLNVYFGEHRIVRSEERPHTVYQIMTKFPIETEVTKQGTLNWNSVITSQMMNDERNNLIVDIVKKFKDIAWIILCKRVTHVKMLKKKLDEAGEYACTLAGNQQQYDKDARILIATFSKCSTGFDHPKLSGMILANDICEFVQCHGRIFRDPRKKPIFIDMVDDFPTLKNHWYQRKKVYESVGGEIVRYNLKKFKKEVLELNEEIMVKPAQY